MPLLSTLYLESCRRNDSAGLAGKRRWGCLQVSPLVFLRNNDPRLVSCVSLINTLKWRALTLLPALISGLTNKLRVSFVMSNLFQATFKFPDYVSTQFSHFKNIRLSSSLCFQLSCKNFYNVRSM